MRAGRTVALAIAASVAAAGGTFVSAHRADEYLQAARLDVEPGRVGVELDLTPGIAVASEVVSDIDRNHDGKLSAEEQAAYEHRVLDAVDVQLDGRALRMRPLASRFPDVEAMRRGDGTIRLRSSAVVPALPAGRHRLLFRNTHRRELSVYLANALVPESDRIGITAQLRDGDQSELTIEFIAR